MGKKFKNENDIGYELPALGIFVKPGEEFEIPDGVEVNITQKGIVPVKGSKKKDK